MSGEEINSSKISILELHFFRLGLKYYIAARYCFFSGLGDISVNQAHHAIEMFLKGVLVKLLSSNTPQLTPEEIEKELRVTYRHNLPQ